MVMKLFVAGLAIVYQIMAAQVLLSQTRKAHKEFCAPNSPDLSSRQIAITVVMALLSLGFAATALVLIWFITGQF